MSEALTTKQVAEHNTVEKGLYIIVDKDVYKLDSFVDEHPGGAKILKRVGGKDASKQFWKVRSAIAVPMFGAWLAVLLRVCLGLDANYIRAVPQRERSEEVRAEAEGWHSQGGSEAMSWLTTRDNILHHYISANLSMRPALSFQLATRRPR